MHRNEITPRTRPVPAFQGGVLAGKSIISIASRSGQSIVLCSDGTLVTSGISGCRPFANHEFQLVYTPVLVDRSGVLLGKTVISAKALDDSFVMLCSDGTVASLAKNTLQQLIDGATLPRNVPLLVNIGGVLADKKVVQITAGQAHCIARCSDGTLATWGTPSVFTSSPVLVPEPANFPGGKVTSISSGGSHNLAIISRSSLTPVVMGLVASTGRLSFDPTITSYKISASHDTTTLSLRVSYSELRGSVTVQNKPLRTATSSELIPLKVGANQIIVTATATDGSVTDYTIQVDRESPSWDSSLSTLIIAGADLTPAFSSKNLNYTATVSNEISSVDLKASPSHQLGSLALNGKDLIASAAALPLQVGTNEFRIKVLAENGIHYSTYLLKIVRKTAGPDLLNLTTSAGPLTVAFSPTTLSYQLRVPAVVTSTTVTPTYSDPMAVVKVNEVVVASGSHSRNVPLIARFNTISVSIKGSDGLPLKTYTLEIWREFSPILPTPPTPQNAVLAGLAVSSTRLSPSFTPEIRSYSATVSSKTRFVKLTATALVAVAAIKINGTLVKSGAAGPPIRLNLGRNTVQVNLIGKDGSKNSYKIIITRLRPSSSQTALPHGLVQSGATTRFATSAIRSVDNNYLTITAAKRHNGSIPRIEVSSNLTDWFSGDQYTDTVINDEHHIAVRDKTKNLAPGRRFIRLRGSVE